MDVSKRAFGDGLGGFFSRKSNRYEARIKVTYVASGDQGNNFQFLYNGWNPSAAGIPLVSDHVSFAHWRNLTTLTDDTGQPIYNPSAYPIFSSMKTMIRSSIASWSTKLLLNSILIKLLSLPTIT
jgi:hypothetical protein